VKKHVALLTIDLDTTRDKMMVEVEEWRRVNGDRLHRVGEEKTKALVQQRMVLQSQCDKLATHHRHVTTTMNEASAPQECIPIYLSLLKKVWWWWW